MLQKIRRLIQARVQQRFNLETVEELGETTYLRSLYTASFHRTYITRSRPAELSRVLQESKFKGSRKRLIRALVSSKTYIAYSLRRAKAKNDQKATRRARLYSQSSLMSFRYSTIELALRKNVPSFALPLHCCDPSRSTYRESEIRFDLFASHNRNGSAIGILKITRRKRVQNTYSLETEFGIWGSLTVSVTRVIPTHSL